MIKFMFLLPENKFEIRSTKPETNLKFEGSNVQNKKVSDLMLSTPAFCRDFEFLSFEIVSNFGIRYSDFRFIRVRVSYYAPLIEFKSTTNEPPRRKQRGIKDFRILSFRT